MFSEIVGFAGSKAALLLAAGTITMSAAGAAAATGNIPGQGNGQSQPKQQATATATATALIETEDAENGLKGRCNAITRGGQGNGMDHKANATAFQDLDCADAEAKTTGQGNNNPGQGNNNPGQGNNNPGQGNSNPGRGNPNPGRP